MNDIQKIDTVSGQNAQNVYGDMIQQTNKFYISNKEQFPDLDIIYNNDLTDEFKKLADDIYNIRMCIPIVPEFIEKSVLPAKVVKYREAGEIVRNLLNMLDLITENTALMSSFKRVDETTKNQFQSLQKCIKVLSKCARANNVMQRRKILDNYFNNNVENHLDSIVWAELWNEIYFAFLENIENLAREKMFE